MRGAVSFLHYLWFYIIFAAILLGAVALVAPRLMKYLDKRRERKAKKDEEKE